MAASTVNRSGACELVEIDDVQHREGTTESCRAVSLFAARFSSRGRLIDTFDAIIYPNDFQISQDSIAIHGITHQQAEREGRPFTEVFLDFRRFIGPRTKTMIGSH